jgi:cytochrome c553|tara:strand:- start:431 stop:868 length:438 start_codon:yes stop_codon:yes gene_type:complete
MKGNKMGIRKSSLILTLSIALVACGENDPGRAKTMAMSDIQRSAIEDRIKSFSVVKVTGGVVQVAQAPDLPGKALYVGCVACHGANGGGGIGPALAGRTHEYIMGRLMAYKAGEKVGAQSNLMWSQASMLSEQDIHDVTEYITTL